MDNGISATASLSFEDLVNRLTSEIEEAIGQIQWTIEKPARRRTEKRDDGEDAS